MVSARRWPRCCLAQTLAVSLALNSSKDAETKQLA
ncbi:transcriptional regulator of the myo-inositol catabolic operon [Klebsiella michiganensis]|uniref:Transcriptional regulator of the myo-inositol catabolic operon n=1 Tax=Klebsiella michiganensis TaxID=1134687 RepID=A0A7H4PQI6_9ENTR|nr:transcriptional regulator of the myo-inositol catabolic operon [Klebsiella michiganensis]